MGKNPAPTKCSWTSWLPIS